jgi:hypothetical protein
MYLLIILGLRAVIECAPEDLFPMSRINGEKARAAIARKRRTAQREKDRTLHAALKQKAAEKETPAKTSAAE